MKKGRCLNIFLFILLVYNTISAHENLNNVDLSLTNFYNVNCTDYQIVTLDSIQIINDTVCLGNGYSEYGFNILSSEIPLPGNYEFFNYFTQNDTNFTIILSLTVIPNTSVTQNITICEGDEYYLNGYFYSAQGTYTQNLTSTNGCDSTITIVLTVNLNPTSNVTHIINQNQIPYSFNNLVFTEGVIDYPVSVAIPNSCDSIINFNLIINWNTFTQISDTICENSLPIVWNGVTFNGPGTQTTTINTYTGADSTITMTLIVLSNSASFVTHTIFENQLPYTFNGEIFTDEIDNYLVTTINSKGCDSLITFNLNVIWNTTTYLIDTICPSSLPYVWNGITFNTADIQSVIYNSYTGADSIVNMTLNLYPTTSTSIIHTITENQLPYTFNGETFTGEVVDFEFIYNNSFGCDSIILFSLQINYNTLTQVFDTICENSFPYVWDGVTFNLPGTQTLTYISSNGSDSVVVMHLSLYENISTIITESITEDQLPYTYNGIIFNHEVINYPIILINSNGCDSVITYNLQINWNTFENIDTTVCINSLPISWRGFVFNQEGSTYDTTVNPNLSLNFQTFSLHVDTFTTILFNGYTNPICPTILNQQIMANVTDGMAPYTFVWSGDSIINSSQNETLIKIAPSNCGDSRKIYLEVEDQIGCIIRDSVEFQINVIETPYLSSTIPTQNCLVNNCQFSIPNLDTLVKTYALDNCYPSDSLTISQNPIAGTIISTNTNVTVTISNPCENSIQTTISVVVPSALSVVINNISHVACYGQNTGGATAVPSNGTPNYGYSWSTQAAPTTIISTTNNISNVVAGSYRVTVTDASGCTATATVTIQNQTNEMNPGSIGSNQNLCFGTIPSTLIGSVASGGNNGTYLWQSSLNNITFSNASGINNTQNYSPTSFNQNTYFRRAWISSACGTVYSETVFIQIFPIYRDTIQDNVCQGYEYLNNGFNLPEDSTQNVGSHIFTQYLSSVNNCDSIIVLNLNILPNVIQELSISSCDSYIWNNNTYTESGEYIQIFDGVNGCDSTVTLHLAINPIQLTTILDTICQGGVYLENGFIFAPPQTNSLQIIEDEITLIGLNGCDSIVSISLSIIDTTMQIEQLTEDFCQYFTTPLAVNGNYDHFHWSTGENSQTITVNSPGIYTVTASNGYCERSTSLVISPCTLSIFIPNTFTPNGDGLNDYFSISSLNVNVLEEFNIVIYNRWGQIVFESFDPNFVWDGKFNYEKVLRSNTYSYVITYRMKNEGSKHIRGSISVL